jgi:hypothetical protein
MQQNVVRAAHSANYGFVMQTLNGAVNADQPKTADHRIERSVPRCPYDAGGRGAVASRPYQKVVFGGEPGWHRHHIFTTAANKNPSSR